MGIFDVFRKPIVIEDDFFGRLKYIKMRAPERSCFEGKGLFEPTGKMIEYFIDGDENGPDLKQKEFYKWMQDNFSQLVTKLTPLVEEEFGNWKQGFKIMDFNKEFELVGVTIPRPINATLKWNMSFDTVHDENHQITVEFIGQEAKEVLIDG